MNIWTFYIKIDLLHEKMSCYMSLCWPPYFGGKNLEEMEQILIFANIEPILVQINIQMIESMAIIEALKEVNLNYIEINKVWQFQLELKRMKI